MPRRRETPAQRRRRIGDAAKARYHAARNDPERVTQPLTPRLLDRELRGAERSRFADVDRALQGQYAVQGEMERRVPQWFADYQAQVRGAEGRVQGYYQGQQAAQQQQAEQAYQQDTTAAQGQQQQMQADAQQRGATVDPALAQQAEQAAASRRTGSQQQAGLTGTLGANAGAYFANRSVVAAGQGLQAQQQLRTQRQGLDTDRQRVARERGDFRVAYRQQARDKERTYGLERAAFGLNQQKAAQDAADDAADNTRQGRADRSRARDRDARRQQARDRENLSRAQFIAKYGITPEQAAQGVEPTRGTGRGGSGGGSQQPGTRQSRSGAKRRFRTAVALIEEGGFRPGQGNGAAAFARDEVDQLDPLLARAAAMTALYDGVDKKTRDRVYREYGIYLRLSKNKPQRRATQRRSGPGARTR